MDYGDWLLLHRDMDPQYNYDYALLGILPAGYICTNNTH